MKVIGEGPLGGVLLLGEHVTKDDLKAKRPFQSKSGLLLRKFVSDLKLGPVRYENVVEFEVSGGINSLYVDGARRRLPKKELLACYEDTLQRVRAINPKIIIALGQTSLNCLIDDSRELYDVHCYVFDSMTTKAPIIPAISPMQLYEKPQNTFWLKYAMAKAKDLLAGKVEAPFDCLIDNDYQQVMTFLDKASSSKMVSIDIETVDTRRKTPEEVSQLVAANNILTAIGISCDDGSALSFDPSCPAWSEGLGIIKGIIENPSIEKIGQNFSFDLAWLQRLLDCRPAGPVWDTMHAANVLYSDLKKGLEELGRFYLFCAPWKGGWNSRGVDLRRYNALDVIATHRIALRQKEEMTRKGVLDYFEGGPKKLFIPAFEMAQRGILMDVEQKAALRAQLETTLEPYLARCVEFAKPFLPKGEKKKSKRDNANDKRVINPSELPDPLPKNYYKAKAADAKKWGHTKDDIYQKAYKTEVELFTRSFNPSSPKQVLAVLSNLGVKIPKLKKASGEYGESTSEKALKLILEKATDPNVIDFVQDMLILRQGNKLLTSYLDAKLDADNRWRVSYNIEGTETGRSSSKKTPWGTGGNNQNIPRGDFLGIKFKNLFITDPGYTLFQSDQEQAEARVVAALSGCKEMLRLFAEGEDIHSYVGSHLCGEDMKLLKLNDPKKFAHYRQYSKIGVHGGNYDMGPTTMSENAVKMGIKLPPAEAARVLKTIKGIFPEIAEWHETIRQTLHKERCLVTPFGRRRVWLGKIGTEMYREAYAHIPQSTVPHITNMMWLWAYEQGIDVLQMGHDALVMRIPNDQLNACVSKYLEQTRKIVFKCGTVEEFNIPWDAAVGASWGKLAKWTP